ncbi:MAG: tRNA-dihydrouridine synthase family protein [Lachnospiraceae bacterium]|nr:tRNA-dihydrouridine synthase family protein [Lachnospiraceae bacterium]
MKGIKEMEYYLAPMEGITGHIYRNAVHEFFGDGVSKYYSPFIVVHEKRAMSFKEIEDILPEHNEGMHLVPQVLTDDAEGFLRIEKKLAEFGYREVNLNLGCPSKTVASKGRGSGFLGRKEALDRFLYEIYEGRVMDISIKTRIGEVDPDELFELIEIYNKYPVKELIIHPRVRYEYYKGKPHRDVFYEGFKLSKNPVCYNGDVLGADDVLKLKEGTEDKLAAIMIGRGMLRDPSLIRTLTGGSPYTAGELKEFLARLRSDYSQLFSGEKPVLQKMKELWGYMKYEFPDKEKQVNSLLKCRTLSEYKNFELFIL